MKDKDAFSISRHAVRCLFDRVAASYDQAGFVQQEIGRRLIERLDYLRIKPRVVLDLGTGTGAVLPMLRMRYPKAQLIGVDLSEGMLRCAQQHDGLWHKFQWLVADAGHLPLPDDSVDLIFSNLMLPWCGFPSDTVWSEMRRILRPNGAFLLTSLGPDTLVELRTAMEQISPGGQHIHTFMDMHNIGDILLGAGFADPVMDAEKLTIQYASVGQLLQDIRQTGGSNIAENRPRTGHRQLTIPSIDTHYPRDVDGRIPATIEVVYGHGWAPGSQMERKGTGEVFVPISSLRTRKP